MKGLKEFLELMFEDKEILEEVENVENDTKKVVKIAKKHGYEFTDDEYNDFKMEIASGGNDYRAPNVFEKWLGGLIIKGVKERVKKFMENEYRRNGEHTTGHEWFYKL